MNEVQSLLNFQDIILMLYILHLYEPERDRHCKMQQGAYFSLEEGLQVSEESTEAEGP
jgi:hypothetical protein